MSERLEHEWHAQRLEIAQEKLNRGTDTWNP